MRALLFSFIFLCPQAFADTFINSPYQLCFTPAQDCTHYVVDAINQAQSTILVQAYSFISTPILQALKQAHTRGVDVRVILDKGQYSKRGKYTSATFLRNANIPTWIDDKVAIAHNKVMIIDNNQVITGSFNFTRAANERNAENLLIIFDDNLATQYTKNWESRKYQSMMLQ